MKLRLGKNSEDEPPTTVPDLIMSAATKYSHCLAIGSKYKKSWQLLTYIEYYEACRRAAKAFLKVPRLRLRNRDALPARVRARERASERGKGPRDLTTAWCFASGCSFAPLSIVAPPFVTWIPCHSVPQFPHVQGSFGIPTCINVCVLRPRG